MKIIFIVILFFLSLFNCGHSPLRIDPNAETVKRGNCFFEAYMIVRFEKKYMSKFSGMVTVDSFEIQPTTNTPMPFVCLKSLTSPETAIMKTVNMDGSFTFDLLDGVYEYTFGIDSGFVQYTGQVEIRRRKFWWASFCEFNILSC